MNLKDEIEKFDYPSGRQIKAARFDKLRKAVEAHTSFLDASYDKVSWSLRANCVIRQQTHTPKCNHPECDNNVKWTSAALKGDFQYKAWFSDHCSYLCMANNPDVKEQRRASNVERYGGGSYLSSEEGKKKYRESMIRNHGVEHNSQIEGFGDKCKSTYKKRTGYSHTTKNPESEKKRLETNIERYGAHSPMHDPVVVEKVVESNKKSNGGVHLFQTEGFKNHTKNVSLERTGYDHFSKSPVIRKKMQQTQKNRNNGVLYNQSHFSDHAFEVLNDPVKLREHYDRFTYMATLAAYLGVHQSTVQRRMNELGVPANQRHKSSMLELEVSDYIESLGASVRLSDRTILSPYEADIVVDDFKLIVEVNGVYWHSEKFKDKHYHQDKTIKAHDAGFNLIHVWEDDWRSTITQDIIKNKIRSKLGLLSERTYARKTTIQTPSKEEVRRLMNANHIQGFVGYSEAYGLYENGELVACLTLRKTKDAGVYDLNRFASSKSVVGGMSKLIAHVKKTLDFKEIYTYAHLDYSKGDVYEKSGFERQHVTPPGLWYVKVGSCERLRRERFMKHKLPTMFENVDLSKTERQIMNENGFYRLYDAGSIKYRMCK